MSDYLEHLIGKETNGFQLVYEDPGHEAITIWGNFKWKNNTDIITEVDFIIKNKKKHDRFKIHEVFYCCEYKRIEVYLSKHPDFKDIEYDAVEDQKLEVEMKENQKIKMVLRVTANNRLPNPKLRCEKIDQKFHHNKRLLHHDQDGSILVGIRP